MTGEFLGSMTRTVMPRIGRRSRGPPDRVPDGAGAPAHGSGGCVMRAGAARGRVGNFHEAGFYGSDAEFAALIVPFVEEGVAAGEPVIIGYDDRKAGLLRSW